MIKYILSGISFALLAPQAHARLAIGPEAGFNISKYSGLFAGSPVQGLSAINTPMFGVVTEVGLTKHIFLQPGAYYMTNGYSYTMLDIPGTGNFYSYFLRVRTISVPLNVEYKFGREGRGGFFIGGGPCVGINVAGNVKSDIRFGGNSKVRIGSDSADIKRLDIGAGINAGYQLAIGFFVRAHYQVGFSNLQPNGDANNTMTSSNYGFSVGYLFPYKKIRKQKSGLAPRR